MTKRSRTPSPNNCSSTSPARISINQFTSPASRISPPRSISVSMLGPLQLSRETTAGRSCRSSRERGGKHHKQHRADRGGRIHQANPDSVSGIEVSPPAPATVRHRSVAPADGTRTADQGEWPGSRLPQYAGRPNRLREVPSCRDASLGHSGSEPASCRTTRLSSDLDHSCLLDHSRRVSSATEGVSCDLQPDKQQLLSEKTNHGADSHYELRP